MKRRSKGLKIKWDAKKCIYERLVTEEDVLGQIRAFLELRGARVFRAIERVPRCYRCGQWLGSSERGHTDLWGWLMRLPDEKDVIRANNYFFIEVKKPGGRRRPAQEDWIRDAKADGVIAFFAESVEDVIKEFEKHGIKL